MKYPAALVFNRHYLLFPDFPFPGRIRKKSLRLEYLRIHIPSKGSLFLIIYISCITILPLLPPHKARLLPGLRTETGSRPVLCPHRSQILSLVLFSFVFSQEIYYHANTVAQSKYPGQRIGQAHCCKTGSPDSQETSQASSCQFPDSRENRMYAVAHSLKRIPKDHQRAVEYKQTAHNE